MTTLPVDAESLGERIRSGEVIAPWPDSPQWRALQSNADIVIFGGAAGGGKSYGMLLAAARGFGDPYYRAVIFRRTYPQLSAPGGLIDESGDLYSFIDGAEYKEGKHEWRMPSGAWLKFSHMQREDDRKGWDGSQLSFVGFDQLEQFTRRQFIYMSSRLRSPDSSIEPQMFATCNPTPQGHWLYEFIRWWLDDEGYPDQSKAGVKRYFFREDDQIVWVDGDARDELGLPPTSVAFVPATVEDNPSIMENDPGYVQRLNSLGRVDRLQQKFGRWGVKDTDSMFSGHRILIVSPDSVPQKMPIVRYWDMADNDGRGAATASAKIGMTQEWRWCCQNAGDDDRGESDCLAEFEKPVDVCTECGCREIAKQRKPVFWVLDVTEWWVEGDAKEKRMQRVADADGPSIDQALEQEPGSAGKRIASIYRDTLFKGRTVHIDSPTGSKTHRAKVLLAPAEKGRLRFVQGQWNVRAQEVLELFPGGKDKDIVDALSGGCGLLESGEIRGERELRIFL